MRRTALANTPEGVAKGLAPAWLRGLRHNMVC